MTELQEHTWADDGGAIPAEPKPLRWTSDWQLRCEFADCTRRQTVSGHYCETHWQEFMALPDCPVKPLSAWGYGL